MACVPRWPHNNSASQSSSYSVCSSVCSQFGVTQKSIDENGNAVSSTLNASLTTVKTAAKKTKRIKGERNTKTCTAQDIEGNRGNDPIESLLSFIENKPETKKQNVINVNKNIINSERHNKKKNEKAKKEAGNEKLKKSTSMEELKSASKMEEERSQRAQVNLRQKSQQQQQQQQQANKKGAGEATKDKHNQNQAQISQQQSMAPNKRNERRSWGTEELNFLGESAAHLDDKESKRKEKDCGNSAGAAKANSSKNNTNSYSNSKKIEQALSIVSIESIPSTGETAEFHVVTKKKKTKKRQLEESRPLQHYNAGNAAMGHGRDHHAYAHTTFGRMTGNNGKYQPSNSYTNDRDVYMKSLTTHENRRKSTSSMPPSEKSDSSDVDSVHSAPSGQSVPTNKDSATINGNSKISYAEIAQGKGGSANTSPSANTIADPWPPVSSPGSSTLSAQSGGSPDTSNLSTCSSKSHTSGRVNNKPSYLDVNDNNSLSYLAVTQSEASANAAQKHISYSQTLIEDKTPALALTPSNATDDVKRGLQIAANVTNIVANAIVGSAKPTLQKSKSEEKDYPALEKTVKPQKPHQNTIIVTPEARVVSAKPQLKTAKSMDSSGFAPSQDLDGHQQAECDVIKAIANDGIDDNSITFIATSAIIPNHNTTNTLKKTRKTSTRSASNTGAPSTTVNRSSSTQSRPAVIIFNDNEPSQDNVSPLLFGDFNDDILQLMKQNADEPTFDDDSGAMQDGETATGRSIHSTSGNGQRQNHQRPPSQHHNHPDHHQQQYNNGNGNDYQVAAIVNDANACGVVFIDVASNQSITSLGNNNYNNYSASNSDSNHPKANHKHRSRDAVTTTDWINQLQQQPQPPIRNADNDPKSINNSKSITNNNNCQTRTMLTVNCIEKLAGVTTAAAQPANQTDVVATEIMCGNDVLVRYVAPQLVLSNEANFIHEKIVNFVGLGKFP